MPCAPAGHGGARAHRALHCLPEAARRRVVWQGGMASSVSRCREGTDRTRSSGPLRRSRPSRPRSRDRCGTEDRAGQVYLGLGKQTGWSMNTQLAGVDASFLAESPGDHAGVSVASAGDVRGDGLDDSLIGATWPGQYTGKAYLILGRQTGWSLDTGLASADASFIGESVRLRRLRGGLGGRSER